MVERLVAETLVNPDFLKYEKRKWVPEFRNIGYLLRDKIWHEIYLEINCTTCNKISTGKKVIRIV